MHDEKPLSNHISIGSMHADFAYPKELEDYFNHIPVVVKKQVLLIEPLSRLIAAQDVDSLS